MSENVPDEKRLASEIDFGNQPVLVPRNVKFHVRLHPVSTPKDLLHLSKALLLAVSRNAIPVIESRARVGTCCFGLSNCLIADDVHVPSFAYVPVTGTFPQAFALSAVKRAFLEPFVFVGKSLPLRLPAARG